MNASEKDRCRRCGARTPAGSTAGLCPACLLSGALATPDDATVSLAAAGSPDPADPGKFPRDFGQYRLVGLLGSGGMGTVYEAEHRGTGRRVALKTLALQLDSPEMRQRFLREGRLAASVAHPNTLYVFGSEEIESTPAITMEIAGGGTLADALRKRGPFPVKAAVDAILDVIAGLESAHAAGVLHRDVKPSNCFLSPDGSVKVGDFGLSVSTLARDDSYVTATGVVMGTPAYAPPEQLRGDELDVRADIYSVGATLFTLLTGKAPFEGRNAVQVVANAVNQKAPPLRDLCGDAPAGLERVVARCLAKEPDQRFPDYPSLRSALLPFCSREPEPASMAVRASAGWIDYLIAFLPPYVSLMFLVGGEELLVRPLVDRTLGAWKYYFLMFAVGFLYFAIVEGTWGAGLGKWLKGLRVIRSNGRPPGFARALLRVVLPVASVEVVRVPVSMAFISDAEWTGLETAMFVVTAIVCGWVPALLAMRARPANGFSTIWDLASGTRVVVVPEGAARLAIRIPTAREATEPAPETLGPFQVVRELDGRRWIEAYDPALRRSVWLLRRDDAEPSPARRDVARPGRLRWLQNVDRNGDVWDAYDAPPGAPFAEVGGNGTPVPWGTLRHWLHDLASELWDASGDGTLPAEAGTDHVWIAAEGRAVLLDRPLPGTGAAAEHVPVGDVAGQQRFLADVAACVDTTGLPLHARPVLRNLEQGKFEKLSFFTGTLRGLLDKPAEVGRGIRAGALFVLPAYVWIAFVVGRYHDKPWTDPGAILADSALLALGAMAVFQLLGLPFRGTVSQAVFRLAVVDGDGKLASRPRLLGRWAIAWLPLLVPAALVTLVAPQIEGYAALLVLALVLSWIGAAAWSVARPHRGLHDRLAGTWVVRR